MHRSARASIAATLFFFSSRRRHTRFDCDWSSDVCSSDLGLMPPRSQAPPRRIAGSLTVPQLAKALAITPHGGSHQLQRGTVVLPREAQTRLSRFPDGPETLEALAQ